MRVLGISGSPRRGGNTDILIHTALDALAAEGIETEFLSPAERPVKPCVACRGCFAGDEIRCVQEDPAFEGVLEKFAAAQGILVGSPVYFGSATPQTMSLLDRFAQLNYFFLISQMIVPGSSYWNVAFGREKGEVQNDAEGIETVKTLARNMAWLMKKLGG
jgi:multimeric flavodoxin WrbA